jgi:hypothetical protein
MKYVGAHLACSQELGKHGVCEPRAELSVLDSNVLASRQTSKLAWILSLFLFATLPYQQAASSLWSNEAVLQQTHVCQRNSILAVPVYKQETIMRKRALFFLEYSSRRLGDETLALYANTGELVYIHADDFVHWRKVV